MKRLVGWLKEWIGGWIDDMLNNLFVCSFFCVSADWLVGWLGLCPIQFGLMSHSELVLSQSPDVPYVPRNIRLFQASFK